MPSRLACRSGSAPFSRSLMAASRVWNLLSVMGLVNLGVVTP